MNGVGGRTIAEAKINIGFKEFQEWIIYRNKYGTLNNGLRIEKAIAVNSFLFANVHRDRKQNTTFRVYDFMPCHPTPPPPPEKEITLEQAMTSWR